MIYSEKVKSWVEKNRPEDVVLSVEQVIAAAKNCGLQAKIRGTEKKEIALRKEEGEFHAEETITLEEDGNIVVGWRDKVNKNEGEIVYSPYVSHGGSYHGLTGIDDSPIKKTFVVLGLEKQSIAMSEPVVQLPVPQWVKLEMLEQEWPNADITSVLLFRTEAKKMAEKFRETLLKEENK